jgi:hypothetical protein
MRQSVLKSASIREGLLKRPTTSGASSRRAQRMRWRSVLVWCFMIANEPVVRESAGSELHLSFRSQFRPRASQQPGSRNEDQQTMPQPGSSRQRLFSVLLLLRE